jgi:hypothetical protein
MYSFVVLDPRPYVNKVCRLTYPLRNDKLYKIYMTPMMDLTGIIITAILDGTSPTLMQTHAMRDGLE